MAGSSKDAWLIVGLGNPGKEYERTRHNCGFRAIDRLAERLNCKIDKAKFQGLYGKVQYNGGRLRVRGDGSAGGHNGIKSIIAQLGSDRFPRVKIGVGAKPHPDADLADWVLGSFSPADEKAVAAALDAAGDAVLCIIEKSIAEAENRFNGFRP